MLPVGAGFRLDPGDACSARSRPIERQAAGRSSSRSAVAARTPAPSIRCRRSQRSAGRRASGCTSTGRTAPSRRSPSAAGRHSKGIELADSVTLDPHKWLYQSYECGCVLVRDGTLLRRAFEIAPDYLLDAVPGEEEVNFSDLGMQLSRTSHALKVWTSVRTFGVAAFRDAIDRSIDQALLAQRLIEESDTLEITSPAQLGVVCFRQALRGGRGRARIGRDARGADRRARALRDRVHLLHATSGAVLDAHVHHELHDARRGCRGDDRVPGRTSRSRDTPRRRPAVFEPHVALERGWLGRPRIIAGRAHAVAAVLGPRRGAGTARARRRDRAHVRGGRGDRRGG